MKLLIIGGTRFVGRAIVQDALDRNHEVTTFNRGKSNPELFPTIEKLIGDRDGGLDVLKKRSWDAVIDTSGYLPRLVGDSARLLADSVNHYTYISSISVYSRFDTPGIDENSPIAKLEDETTEIVDASTYGALKALCEKEVNTIFGDQRCVHLRAGLIIGPHDHSDRLTYWAYRVRQGGELLVPGHPETPIQFIDARDLARWALKTTEEKLTGKFISTGPNYTLTLAKVLETAKTLTGSDARFTWVGDDLLAETGYQKEQDMPWWIPEAYIGYGTFNNQKAIKNGIELRPLEETIRDTLDWHLTREPYDNWQSGLRENDEKRLLRLWHRSKV